MRKSRIKNTIPPFYFTCARSRALLQKTYKNAQRKIKFCCYFIPMRTFLHFAIVYNKWQQAHKVTYKPLTCSRRQFAMVHVVPTRTPLTVDRLAQEHRLPSAGTVKIKKEISVSYLLYFINPLAWHVCILYYGHAVVLCNKLKTSAVFNIPIWLLVNWD